MAKRIDIDDILRKWPFDPQSVSVRLVEARGGREVLQMRVEMGLLQMEIAGRPDGTQPQGVETYYDHLVELVFHEGPDFELSEPQCIEIDREFVQYYHRRICWLALREYGKAAADAQHTLKLMDFCRNHSSDEQWTLSHEQYRPFVMFHQVQAAALAELERTGPEQAIELVNQGLDRMRDVFVEYDAEEEFDDDELVERLIELRELVREQYEVGKTLQEQLSEAVDHEEYERAARLRDKIARRLRKRS